MTPRRGQYLRGWKGLAVHPKWVTYIDALRPQDACGEGSPRAVARSFPSHLVLLGQVGLTRAQDGLGGRTRALTGVLIGLGSLAFSAALLTYVLVTGDYPQWMPW
jgi:hypothetical protein